MAHTSAAKPAAYVHRSLGESYTPAASAAGSAVAERAREEDAAAAKHETGTKRKKGAAGAAMPSAPLNEASKQELGGHSQAVSSVAWPSAETIFSGSWDNSVSAASLHWQIMPSAGPC